MVTVRFLRTDGTEVHRAGPFAWVRVAGGSLQAGPDGQEIARYRGGIWTLDGQSVPKYVVHGSTCSVRFEADSPDDSPLYGPFDQVELVDGAVYVQPGRRLLARLDERDQSWYSYEDKRSWRSMVVEKNS